MFKTGGGVNSSDLFRSDCAFPSPTFVKLDICAVYVYMELSEQYDVNVDDRP
jgi:hypothetical protein